MRIIALAGAIMLLAVAGASAQTAAQMQQIQSAIANAQASGATSGTGSGNSQSANAAAAAAVRPSQSSGVSSNPLAGATSGSAGVGSAVAATQNTLQSVAGYINTTDGLLLPVFGTELFTGSFAGTRPADRPDYAIQPGDQVVVNLYGAVNNGGVQTVDASGNVFIVGVGPIHVAGVSAGGLQGAVSARVREIFTSAVGVYATVSQAGSIGVYVSGDVTRPGRYLGGARDSVLFYLSQAGGIDAARGSFRNITVQRGGQIIARYDLYDFLLSGHTQPLHFEDGDVVLVAPRGAMIGVTGNVRNAFAFEAPAGTSRMTGADLLPITRLEPTVTGAALHGYRDGSPKAAYFTLPEFSRVVLADGDHVEFRADSFVDTVTVTVQGQIKGPSIYVMPRGSTLSQLLARIPLDGTDVEPRFVHVSEPKWRWNRSGRSRKLCSICRSRS